MAIIEGPLSGTPEWYEYRVYDPSREKWPLVFGASEAGAVLGVSPYTSRLELFCIKTKRATIDDNLAMACGRALEPVVLDAYQKETGCALTRNSAMFFNQDYPLLSATPDAVPVRGKKTLVESHTQSCRLGAMN